MGKRLVNSTRVLAIAIAFMLVASAAGENRVAAKKATTKTGALPRTPWGEPDLQGIWDFATITPLERPSELAGKEFLTDQEAAELERRTVESHNADARDT